MIFFRVLESGQTPYFCFHEGFCRYFDTRKRLAEHYAKFPNHNIPPSELNKLRKQAQEIQDRRRKATAEKAEKAELAEKAERAERAKSVCDANTTLNRSTSVTSSRSDVRNCQRSKSPTPRFR